MAAHVGKSPLSPLFQRGERGATSFEPLEAVARPFGRCRPCADSLLALFEGEGMFKRAPLRRVLTAATGVWMTGK